MEAVVGAEKRIGLVAEDFVKHWDARLEVMDGKAMIVCMSRRICYELYEAIRKLRPGWHYQDDDKGVIKIVMTGLPSDPLAWQDHIRNQPRREALAKRFKHPQDPLKIVLVRDRWLTGFDAPSLRTMYADKPMRSPGLMQAIARVNRVFKDKPGGLVVDYLGLAQELKEALAVYTGASFSFSPKSDCRRTNSHEPLNALSAGSTAPVAELARAGSDSVGCQRIFLSARVIYKIAVLGRKKLESPLEAGRGNQLVHGLSGVGLEPGAQAGNHVLDRSGFEFA